eukprot:symbB.v1.2.033465.t2/scaffold4158.1/size77177/2
MNWLKNIYIRAPVQKRRRWILRMGKLRLQTTTWKIQKLMRQSKLRTMGHVLFIVQQFVGNVANEAATSAFPGLHRDTGRCAAGQRAPGAPHSRVMAGDCSASMPRVRRFCVCRLPLVASQSLGGGTNLRLRSPGLHFAFGALEVLLLLAVP